MVSIPALADRVNVRSSLMKKGFDFELLQVTPI